MKKFYKILVHIISILSVVCQIFVISEYFGKVFDASIKNKIIAAVALIVVLFILYFILWLIGEEITTMLILEFVLNLGLAVVSVLLNFKIPEFIFYIVYIGTVLLLIWIESDGSFIDGRWVKSP